MDSPIEVSNHRVKSYNSTSNGKEYEINFVLHQSTDYDGFDAYFENVKRIVEAEKDVFGELPAFDFGSYYFLACYMPQVAGDGMEHRNSTILTDQNSISNGGHLQNIGTVTHEFFHAWNVERIRPASLEPFDFSKANMSGELWFAEGFTSYYTALILCRIGITSKENYAANLSGTLSYVWNSPARKIFNPIELSYQAPFTDAATSIDQVNWENTSISHYSYGKVLALALDLSLRNLKEEKTLDGFMKSVWESYGKNEIPYTIKNLEDSLADYTTKSFSDHFFGQYIYSSEMPDYEMLLASAGIDFSSPYELQASFGAKILNQDNKWLVSSNPAQGSAMYDAGLSKGDHIISIDGKLTNNKQKPNTFLNAYKAGDSVKVIFNRFGQKMETMMTFSPNLSFKTSLMESVSKEVKKRQNKWLEKAGN